MAQGWENDPELRNQKLAIPKGKGYRLAHHPDGSCIFLQKDGLCRIHARFGEPAKPLPCRLYPFRFVTLGSQVRADIRYDCPEVANNRGKPITTYRSYLKSLLLNLVSENSASNPAPPFFRKVSMNWEQLCRITETFERVIMTESLDITRRIVACVNLAALLHKPQIAALEGPVLNAFLEKVTAKLIAGVADDPLARVAPLRFTRLLFRQILVIYTREDRVGQHSPLGQRLITMLRMVIGSGTIPSLRQDLPTVSFADLEQTFCLPSPEVSAILTRFFRMRLNSMGFFGKNFYGRSYLDGINALFLTYPIIHWIARAYAAADDLDAPDANCITKALQIMAHQHGATPVLDIPSERIRTRFLCERSHLRSLVVWYGS